MVLKDFLAISGEPGLFKFIAQGKNAIIVEHLESGKRSSAFGSAKVSSLEEIAIFTTEEDMPLGKVFDLISDKENGGESIDSKSDPIKLKEYFASVLPQYDSNRVYTSDIKKVLQWYNTLHKLGLLVKEEVVKESDTNTETGEADLEEVKQAETKKSKSTAPKKTTAKKTGAKSSKDK